MAKPNQPASAEEIETLSNRITVLAWELTSVIRGAAMLGLDFRVDLVERDDPLNPGGWYTDIQVIRIDDEGK